MERVTPLRDEDRFFDAVRGLLGLLARAPPRFANALFHATTIRQIEIDAIVAAS